MFEIYTIAYAAKSADENANLAVNETAAGLTNFATTIWDGIPYFIAAVIVIVISYFLAKKARNSAEDLLLRTSSHASGAMSLVGKTAFSAVFISGVMTALNILNVDLTLIMSAIGFGLGFAIKDIIFNYLAGLFIIFTSPFDIGDVVKVGDDLGTVKSIESRSVILRTLDGQKLVISNADMFNSRLTNYSSYPERRVEVVVGVDYDTDLEQAMNILNAIVAKDEHILKKPLPAVILTSFNDSSIDFSVKFWVDIEENWMEAKSVVISRIKEAFDVHNINIPYPIQTLVSKDASAVALQMMTAEELQSQKDAIAKNAEVTGDVFDSGNSVDYSSIRLTHDAMKELEQKGREKRAKQELEKTPEAKPTPKPDTDIPVVLETKEPVKEEKPAIKKKEEVLVQEDGLDDDPVVRTQKKEKASESGDPFEEVQSKDRLVL
ncbi:MAG: mechanosensitive ion channel [Patescibacteria group bacterium]|nr:mechanosensitive ion channel [Patescibacteria group bacterium]